RTEPKEETMDIFRELLGGGEQRQSYEDFVRRYQQGPPSEGYSGEEVMERYQRVAPNLSSQDFMQAAHQAFANMSPEEREQFAQYVNQEARQRQVTIPQFSGQR